MNPLKINRIRHVAVYCGSRLPQAPEYAEAVREFGAFLAEHDMELIYGGSNAGLMKLLAVRCWRTAGASSAFSPPRCPTR